MPLPTFPNLPPLLDSDQDESEIQEAEAGLNAERTASGWSWHRSKVEIDTIVTFLRANGVSGFQFTPPTIGETADFKCLRRKRREIASDSDRLDCELERSLGRESSLILPSPHR